ncbi:hypothetical protein ACIBQ1_35805 [Nonomuraea sp. NPDC050153]|uniref:hypothetical protein n=1 Tax=Nonomuraea sp. NPDC050153 TaxID=3364359 RepID=UPI0037B2E165
MKYSRVWFFCPPLAPIAWKSGATRGATPCATVEPGAAGAEVGVEAGHVPGPPHRGL